MIESAVSEKKGTYILPKTLKIPFNVWMWVLAILMLGAMATLAMSSIMRERNALFSKESFSRQVDIATTQLENAIEKDTALAVAVQGMFHSFDKVSRDEFRRFVDAVDIERLFPDTQALSWNALVPEGQTAAFERSVQLDDSVQAGGYPDFAVKPVEAPEPRYVVTYIEPMKGNEGAFGFDIGSNLARRKTVELARDLNEAQATAPITLAQGTGNQKGFLMILPVYQTANPKGLALRRQQFRGVVVAVFRIDDLVIESGVLDFSSVQIRDVTDRHDGEGTVAPVIYQQGEQAHVVGDNSLLRRIPVAGRLWEVSYSQSAEVLSNESRLSKWAVPALGALSSALAALLVGYLATSRQRTLLRAESLTIDLQRANDDLSRSNSELSQFAHVASHDLQTPVRNIMGSVTMLEDAIEEKDVDGIERYLDFLKGSALRMKALISDLLRYAESGQELEQESVDLNATLALVAAATQDICRSKAASLQIGPMPIVLGDEQQLDRVFTNLITNALKYSKEGVAPLVQVTAGEAGDYHEIRIRDNGLGIELDHQATIFEPFKRLHRQSDVAGTGLGLAICRQIVDRHGGSIGVEQSSEAGSTILLRLPRQS